MNSMQALLCKNTFQFMILVGYLQILAEEFNSTKQNSVQ